MEGKIHTIDGIRYSEEMLKEALKIYKAFKDMKVLEHEKG
jgi:hypothetical protein